MRLFIILGNQLFNPNYLKNFKDHIFYMAEDYELCTYEKHHKLKILLFLSSMRSHADQLKKKKFKLEYSKIDSNDFKKDYLECNISYPTFSIVVKIGVADIAF